MNQVSEAGWVAIRQIVVMIVLVCCLAYGYQSGWSNSPDFKTLIATLMSLLTVDGVKAWYSAPKTNDRN